MTRNDDAGAHEAEAGERVDADVDARVALREWALQASVAMPRSIDDLTRDDWLGYIRVEKVIDRLLPPAEPTSWVITAARYALEGEYDRAVATIAQGPFENLETESERQPSK